jgi:outer membrane receptor protein involved in Fe transport
MSMLRGRQRRKIFPVGINVDCCRVRGYVWSPVRPFHAFAALAILPVAFGQVQVLDPLSVSATRDPEPISQVPYTVEVVSASELNDGSSLTVDDALRGYADFSLFRRNDSMTANPTSQGVSLRGLGPSGASRSLVLLDGVPLNDPFGGWVPWSLVPLDSLSGAEIVPGGGASAWGNEALAGVIQLFSARPLPGSGDAVVRAGDFGTRSADLAEAIPAGPGTLELRGEEFATDGTHLIAPGQSGPIDIDAASRHSVASAAWRGTVGQDIGVVVTLRRYDEWRDNGTPYQQNRFRQLFGSVALTGRESPGETWNLTAYMEDQGSSQTFSAVNNARTAEAPASDQFAVPTTALGLAGSSTWADRSGGSTTVGTDVRDIRGETREDYSYANGAYADQRFAGGRQTFAGLFAERSQPLGPSLHAIAGLRLDRWEDSDGHLRNVAAASGALLLQSFYPTRTGTELSPSAGVTWQATKELEFHVDAQRAFRQPTLNELYRPFRQGNTTTLANPALSTEHADSGELGAAWRRGGLTVTLEGYAARLEDAVSNVNIAQGPGTFPLFGTLPAGSIGQERLNLGRVDTEGVQLGADWEQSDELTFNLSVLDEEATVGAASVAPSLVGTTLPEVPRWNASLGLTWRPMRRVFLSGRVRRTGSQFDDSQNQLPLAAATVADVALRVVLSGHAELFASVDNLFDAEVETAHSALGVFSVAPPRIAGGGARLSW